ncbi:hypothetical protein MLD38_020544 [Melastoma candidum]|uniref:Uncharacterized protein n=1 Tax=Melastoma candidum TaxID=119954 RepID=A0ACB9QD81_9MYRT|nr:hypothetical protein MLD38_020544 [Melastoma candidum]
MLVLDLFNRGREFPSSSPSESESLTGVGDFDSGHIVFSPFSSWLSPDAATHDSFSSTAAWSEMPGSLSGASRLSISAGTSILKSRAVLRLAFLSKFSLVALPSWIRYLS